MTTTVTVTKQLNTDHWLVTAVVSSGGTLPVEIFVYTNTGTDVLGDFYGVCSVKELSRLKIFSGSTIDTFGNNFVRYGQAKIKVGLQDNAQTVIDTLIASVKRLSTAYAAQTNTSQTYTIT